MVETRFLLSNYYDILEENRTAKYLQCKHTPLIFNIKESTKNLWEIHDKSLQKIKQTELEPKQSLLNLKIELASRIFHECHFCERRCKTDRTKNKGICKVKQPSISSEFLHIGEENVLVPSYTIFFSGCTFNCVFCQNWDISQQICGIYIKPEILVKMIEKRKQQGARNVNWVGGDPTPNIPYILEVLKKCNVNIPQVWNSNMYCSNETMKLLDGVIDLYLTDFKYGNNKCAKRLSKVDNYIEIIKRNHLKAYDNGEMIIRHLVMPNHLDCCSKPIIKWISENLPNATVNIMAQYRPEYKAYDHNDISKPVSFDKVLQAREYANELNIHEI
jgi:putative pyruvate formate lyase activating enzyme